jgi:predicted Abi (CAAX) family protease
MPTLEKIFRRISWLLMAMSLVWALNIGLYRSPHQSIASPISPAVSQPPASRPIIPWQGRLELPTMAEIAVDQSRDWVWIQLDLAPKPELIGQRLKLVRLQAPVSRATTAVQFSPAATASLAQGNIHPQRLDGRPRVTSLQSLAGARAQDNVYVKLTEAIFTAAGNLEIDREPIQTTGQQRLLVQLGQPTAQQPELFPSRAYNPQTERFDGESRIVRIPQIPATKHGLYPSTIKGLSNSPAGRDGWYLLGSEKSSDPFIVESLVPRSLLAIQKDRQIDNLATYLDRENWADLAKRQGQISRITTGSQLPTVGQRALLVHSFGEISGQGGDVPSTPLTVTGHFAYGLATVVRDEITNQPRWDLVYNQVYAHNPDGIVAGKQDWATYMGQLQRGWMGTRPVVDALIEYPPVTSDYDFDGVKFSPLDTLQQQLELSAARYRVGDGTGTATVTPATSCVQDANQALYLTINQLTQQVTPQIQNWLKTHPQDPQALRFQKLQALGRDLTAQLAPLGIVRSDWSANAQKLSGTSTLTNSSHPIFALFTWRTMLPRRAQDGILKILARHGAQITLLQTVQIGGVNHQIGPVAPTVLFGRWPWLSTSAVRLWAGLTTWPTPLWSTVGLGLGLVVGYGAIASICGRLTGFLNWQRWSGSRQDFVLLIQLFWAPALIEELLFRGLLLPHPIEGASISQIATATIASTLLFIIYHPVNALLFYPPGRPTFWDWRFLSLTGLLGMICAIGYLYSGSLWLPVIIHWVVVSSWILLAGGKAKLA